LQYDVPGSRCLDLFSGSGALGFEAASRGATRVVQVEKNAQVCREIHAATTKLGAAQIKLVNQDVFTFLAGDVELFDLVFMDPPFTASIVLQVCQWLEDKCWLAQQAKIYIEVKSSSQIETLPENWQLLKNKKAGDVSYFLFQRIGP
jgi:16S rRNA (guanine966-N2)-methyltransferase